MPRSNGSFPEYRKIEIDPEDWPSNYWDSSRGCRECEIRWPNHELFISCLECGGKLTILRSSPDIRWPEAVKQYLSAVFNRLYDKWNEGVTDEELYWEELKTDGDLDPHKVTNALDELINEWSHPTTSIQSGSDDEPNQSDYTL